MHRWRKGWMGVVFGLLCLGNLGCGRDLMGFGVVAAGMTVPTVEIREENISRFLDRIRWMERATFWENRLIRPHELSSLLSKSKPFVQSPSCSPNCRDCLSGDVQRGSLNVGCWTNGGVSGSLELEVPDLTSLGGQAFEVWGDLCRPMTHKDSPTASGVCYQGETGYQALLDKTRATRLDVLWVVRLWVQEGNASPIRLDGAVGAVFRERLSKPTVRRTAVYLEDRSLIYQKYSFANGQGSVELLAHNGSFQCTFSVQESGSELQKSGTCRPLSGVGENLSW